MIVTVYVCKATANRCVLRWSASCVDCKLVTLHVDDVISISIHFRSKGQAFTCTENMDT